MFKNEWIFWKCGKTQFNQTNTMDLNLKLIKQQQQSSLGEFLIKGANFFEHNENSTSIILKTISNCI
jgi:hypothetical protein